MASSPGHPGGGSLRNSVSVVLGIVAQTMVLCPLIVSEPLNRDKVAKPKQLRAENDEGGLEGVGVG